MRLYQNEFQNWWSVVPLSFPFSQGVGEEKTYWLEGAEQSMSRDTSESEIELHKQDYHTEPSVLDPHHHANGVPRQRSWETDTPVGEEAINFPRAPTESENLVNEEIAKICDGPSKANQEVRKDVEDTELTQIKETESEAVETLQTQIAV